MKLATLAATAALAMTAVAAAPTAGRAAEIRLICSNGYHAVIDVLGPQYEKATGHKLVVSYGLAAALGKEIEGGNSDVGMAGGPQEFNIASDSWQRELLLQQVGQVLVPRQAVVDEHGRAAVAALLSRRHEDTKNTKSRLVRLRALRALR